VAGGGLRRAGGGKGFGNFAIQGQVHVEIDSDVKAALAKLKPEVALYVGGMGHRDKNFHKDMMVRRGFKASRRAHPGALSRAPQGEAAAAVPDEWVDAKSLVGPPERIKQRFRAWEDSGATGLTVRSKDAQAIEVMADAARLNRR
jgi:alkanesulfonate monooxygenase SsuD/methylene tetrahydromethanopterin reductase-like flavin-dependent oxidoreductase (luciferase family)